MSYSPKPIEQDISCYLKKQEEKDLLRLLTCGSVDDGKSTLIGRLLHDSQLVYDDQLATLVKDSKKSGTTRGEVDLALLVDGLQAEREQGITIDVAYRFFTTAKRKFIIADTPGHEQYTRNMATGASTAQLALILIDACHGVQTQTLRHSMIASLLGIPHFIVVVNKMDRVSYDQSIFEEIRKDYERHLSMSVLSQTPESLDFVPISALKGDNVVTRSGAMPWYKKAPLMEQLETLPISDKKEYGPTRLPIQYVNRPDATFRGYCGNLRSGSLASGDVVTVLPAGKKTRIATILGSDGEQEKAWSPMALTVTLQDDIDISRGDMLVVEGQQPAPLLGQEFIATIIWMMETPLSIGTPYALKIESRIVTASIHAVLEHIDPNTSVKTASQPQDVRQSLNLNEIASCHVVAEETIVCDPYQQCRGTGAFILIDRISNLTVGAGLIQETVDTPRGEARPGPHSAASHSVHPGLTVLVSGTAAYTDSAWRTELAAAVQDCFVQHGGLCAVIDARSWQNTLLLHHLRHCAPTLNEAGLLCIFIIDKPGTELMAHCQKEPNICRHIHCTVPEALDREEYFRAARNWLLTTLEEQKLLPIPR